MLEFDPMGNLKSTTASEKRAPCNKYQLVFCCFASSELSRLYGTVHFVTYLYLPLEAGDASQGGMIMRRVF